MAPVRDRRVALIALAMLVVGVIALPVGFRLASSGLVRRVREMENRAIAVIERSRVPELELRYGPDRMADGQIRIAWSISMFGSPELLRMVFQDDPSWQPGRGVWVHATYRSDLELRQTCLRLAEKIGHPAGKCPEREEGEVYWLAIEGERADGGVEIYLRRLRDESGVLEGDFSVVAEFNVKACGTLREPGTGPCP